MTITTVEDRGGNGLTGSLFGARFDPLSYVTPFGLSDSCSSLLVTFPAVDSVTACDSCRWLLSLYSGSGSQFQADVLPLLRSMLSARRRPCIACFAQEG